MLNILRIMFHLAVNVFGFLALLALFFSATVRKKFLEFVEAVMETFK